jgi:hypothetical protein
MFLAGRNDGKPSNGWIPKDKERSTGLLFSFLIFPKKINNGIGVSHNFIAWVGSVIYRIVIFNDW